MKLNKTLKFLITLNGIISVIVVIIKIGGGTFTDPINDVKAISNSTEFMTKDTLTVDSIRYNVDEGKTTPDTFKFRIYLTSKKGQKKEVYYFQKRYNINLLKYDGNDKMILLRNKINDNVFLDDEEYIKYMSRSNYITLYFYLLLTLLLILINKINVFKK